MPSNPPHSWTSLPLVFDEDLPIAAKAIDVLTAGDLVVIDRENETVTYTFTEFDASAPGSYSIFPYRVELGVRQVVGDGTGEPGSPGTTCDIILLH